MGTEGLGTLHYVAAKRGVFGVRVAVLAYEIVLSRSYLAQLARFVEQHPQRYVL